MIACNANTNRTDIFLQINSINKAILNYKDV